MGKMLKVSEQVLSPVDLDKTLGDLTAYQYQFTLLRQRVQQASDQKGNLLRSKFTLETEISLAESDAIMSIQGEGKDAHVVIDGVKIPMTNDTARKAYMQSVAQDERLALAEVEGQIAQIDADRFRLNDEISILQQEMSAAQSKANLQASLLQFMASVCDEQ